MSQGIDTNPIRNRIKGFKRTLITSVVVLTTLFLLACGTSEEPPATSPAVAKARVGGTIVMSLNHPQSLNPILNPVSTTIFTSPLFFNGLTKPGDNMEPLPDLAKSWDVSADGLSYTFVLRDDVKWHDGQDFTSQDVRFSWEATCHPDNARGRQICGFFSRVNGARAYQAGEATGISGLSLPTAHTLQVEMTEVFACEGNGRPPRF